MILNYIHQTDCIPDDIDPEVTRVLARLLNVFGRVLDNIEACAAQDARDAVTGEDEHVSFVMSFYYDVREVFDDFLV